MSGVVVCGKNEVEVIVDTFVIVLLLDHMSALTLKEDLYHVHTVGG